jgi:hypothetical protein
MSDFLITTLVLLEIAFVLKFASFVVPLVCLVSDPRGDGEEFDTLGVARIS